MISAEMNPIIWMTAVLAAVYLLVFCYRGPSWAKSIVKTLSIAGLAVAAWLVAASPLLVIALTLCAMGDLLLSREDDHSFLAGVGAFALGHLAYITLFVTHSFAQPNLIVSVPEVYFLAALVLLCVIMAIVLLPRAGDLRVAVLAYIPIIAGMGIAALGLPLPGLLIGALLFVLSDFVLAMEMFVLSKTAPARRITPFVVWLTYWLAQFTLFTALA